MYVLSLVKGVLVEGKDRRIKIVIVNRTKFGSLIRTKRERE